MLLEAAYVLLAVFVAVVPVVMWNGTVTSEGIKLLCARTLTIALSVLIIADALVRRTLRLPDRALLLLAAATGAYATVLCAVNPFSDWGSLADLWLSILLLLEGIVLLREGAVERILVAWQTGALIVSLYLLLQRAGLDPLLWLDRPTEWAGSTFANRNLMVFYLLCSLPYGIYLVAHRRGAVRVLGTAAAAMGLAALLLCHSRASVAVRLITAPGYLLHMSCRSPSPLWRTALRWCAMGCFALASALAVGYAVYVFSAPSWAVNTLSHQRLLLWRDTLGLVAEAPWFGHGPGSFAGAFPAFRSAELAAAFPFHVPVLNSHNEVLEVLVEGGVVGLLLSIALAARSMGAGRAKTGTTPSLSDLRSYGWMSVVGCALFALVAEASHFYVCSVFCWLSLAVCSVSWSEDGVTVVLSGRRRRLSVAALVVWSAAAVAWQLLAANAFLADVHTKRAIAALQNSRGTAGAERELASALQYQPANLSALYLRAHVYAQQGKYDDALRDYEAVQRQDPHFEHTHYDKGVLLFQQKDYAAAAQSLNATLRLYPTCANALFYLARCHYEMAQYDACIGCCRLLMRLENPHGRARELLIAAKRGVGAHHTATD